MAAIISILLTAIIIIASVLLVLIVLVQRPKQEGLGAAFGGGAFDSALGAHTTDILQKITTYLAIVFFTSAIGLAMVKARQFKLSPANNVLENVDKRDAEVPTMPSSISDIPGLGTEGDVTAPTPILNDTPAPAATPETPAPAAPEEADAPAAPAEADAAPEKADAAAPEAPAAPEEAGKGSGKGK